MIHHVTNIYTACRSEGINRGSHTSAGVSIAVVYNESFSRALSTACSCIQT